MMFCDKVYLVSYSKSSLMRLGFRLSGVKDYRVIVHFFFYTPSTSKLPDSNICFKGFDFGFLVFYYIVAFL